jgi:uncharacterized protein (DUF3084 family)
VDINHEIEDKAADLEKINDLENIFLRNEEIYRRDLQIQELNDKLERAENKRFFLERELDKVEEKYHNAKKRLRQYEDEKTK